LIPVVAAFTRRVATPQLNRNDRSFRISAIKNDMLMTCRLSQVAVLAPV